jgi:hypothetical protein
LHDKGKSASLTFVDQSQLHTRAMINHSPKRYVVHIHYSLKF